jgi:hypothetical protein
MLSRSKNHVSIWMGLLFIYFQILASLPPLSPSPLVLFEACLSHLWSIWECLVLCEPILVFGPSPALTSQAVWWFRDLLRPVRIIITATLALSTDRLIDASGKRHQTLFYHPRQRSLFSGEQNAAQGRFANRRDQSVLRKVLYALASYTERGPEVCKLYFRTEFFFGRLQPSWEN